jgi:hypothetical protein
MEEITIATNCYELDYRVVLNLAYGKKLFHTSNDIFTNRMLTINNVNNLEDIKEMANKAIEEGLISQYYFCSEVGNDIMSTYTGCERESFVQKYPVKRCVLYALRNKRKYKRKFDGINYSLPMMCAIEKCKTRWLVWCTEDVLFPDETVREWITKSIEVMKTNEKILVANPLWNGDNRCAEEESVYQDENFWYSYAFSDQCFLIDVQRARKIKSIYSERNDYSEKVFPMKGGNDFEKRINAYMRNHDLQRITYKHVSYTHESFTPKKIRLFLKENN